MATKQVAVRLDVQLLEWIDAYVEHLYAQTPSVNLTRADGIRVLIASAPKQSPVPKPQGHEEGRSKASQLLVQ